MHAGGDVESMHVFSCFCLAFSCFLRVQKIWKSLEILGNPWFSKNFQRFPKISKDFQRIPKFSKVSQSFPKFPKFAKEPETPEKIKSESGQFLQPAVLMSFFGTGQKDAQGPLSSLWAHTKGV